MKGHLPLAEFFTKARKVARVSNSCTDPSRKCRSASLARTVSRSAISARVAVLCDEGGPTISSSSSSERCVTLYIE